MKLLLITFSLRNRTRDYTQFFVNLRGNALQWWHFIEQTCVVATMLDVSTYTQRLLPFIEKTDSLLVTEIVPHEFQGWLPNEAWEWLNSVSRSVNQFQLKLPAPAPIPNPK